MITSIFSKSRPINYILITTAFVLCYFLYQLFSPTLINSGVGILKKTFFLLLLVGSLLITNFITKKNDLSKDNSYTFLFFFTFLILFPNCLSNGPLIISNALILLSLRRLISLQSMITPKEKIFDASLWIFTASIFYFWSILFILLVFISILLHAARDYRNWIIPIIAFFIVAIIGQALAIFLNVSVIDIYFKNISFNFDSEYCFINISYHSDRSFFYND
jgi:hypothetical protein